MSKIRIKNFGPIKEGFGTEWIDVKKVTVFIGNQGSGKSTIAKLISTFTWMEKALVRGDIKAKDLEIYNRFRKKHCAYQNIHNFFRDESEIEYSGFAYSFKYSETNFKVFKNKNDGYLIPKVMYVPAERNFVSAVVQPEKLKYLPFTLNTFLEEFIRSNEEIDDNLKIPINDIEYRFDKKKRSFKLYGNDYEIILSEASSGLQSSIPLYLVSKNLAEGINKVTDFTKTKLSIEEKEKLRNQLLKILIDKTINEDLQNTAIDLLSNLTKNDCFINIVEEPEQNLFPSSQQKMLNSLLEFNNINKGNKLIMTTHSPYLINYLTLAVEANKLKPKVNSDDLKAKLNEIVPLVSTVDGNDLVVYQLDEKNGTIEKLKEYKGLPSDENYLNEGLAESNDEFSKLLDLEDLCQ
ncbi:MAG: ATP-binding protein [Saprospiraceae bacterium]|nr:ATP-binding protein [Candidatus Defluviibacterium haderslevense]